MPARLEALAALGGMTRAALHSQLAAAVQVVLHVQRGADGSRGLREIGLLEPAHDGRVHIVAAWRADGGPAPAAPRLAELFAERSIR